MKVDEGLLALRTQEEGTVGGVVHEEVFGEDGGAGGVAEEVEVGFEVGVGVGVGVVGAEAVAGKVGPGGGVEGGGEGIGTGVATGGVSAPAAGGEPAVAPAGGVAVDGDEEDVVFAQLTAPLVHAAAALGQGDVRFLRHQVRGVQAPGLKGGDDVAGFSSGVIIAAVCLFFIPPLGEIASSAISIVSELLVLCGAILGVKASYDVKFRKFEAELRDVIENEKKLNS